jgi:hypothetical protein
VGTDNGLGLGVAHRPGSQEAGVGQAALGPVTGMMVAASGSGGTEN